MKTLKLFLSDLGLVLAAVAASVFLMMAGLWLSGFPAHHVLADWITGAIGTRYDLMASLKNASPLIFTGLAAGIAFRSGVFNIGAEGQAILGSIAAVAVATRIFPAAPVWLAIPGALVAAILAGAIWALIAGALERSRGVPVVLS